MKKQSLKKLLIDKLRRVFNSFDWYKLDDSKRFSYAKEIYLQTVCSESVEVLTKKILNAPVGYRKSDAQEEQEQKPFLFQYWHQGLENTPQVVENAYESVDIYLSDFFEIRRIDFVNLSNFISLADHIIDAVVTGRMSLAHFSDIVRNKLLLDYGGLWLDSTVLLTGTNSVRLFCLEDRIRFQNMPVLINPKHLPIAVGSWMIWAYKPGCRIFAMADSILEVYWRENDRINNYFLYHIIITALLRLDIQSQKDIDLHKRFYSDSSMDLLYFYLDRVYNPTEIQELFNRVDIHKLDFKLSVQDLQSDILKNRDVFYNRDNFNRYFKNVFFDMSTNFIKDSLS